MGFIKAFTGALTGTFADQWLEYMMPASGLPDTAAIFPAVKKSTNAGRGENTKGYENIITSGSKIVVPENTALITIQDGAITGCITEAGGYTFTTDDPNAQSLFAGGGILASTLGSTWEKVKFGGIPASQQTAIYVNLREIPNNKFGTQDPVRWMDNFFETQVGGILRGTYSIKVVDPLTFVKNSVPPSYLLPNAPIFDLADMDNDYTEELFNNVVASLSQSLQTYASTKARENNDLSSIESIKSDTFGLAKAMSDTVEAVYQWRTNKGIEIVNTSIIGFDYDEPTKELLADFQQDDREVRKAKRMGAAYSANMPGMMAAATGESMKSAAANENGAMAGFMGFGMAQQQGASVLNTVMQQQPVQQQPMQQPVPQPQEQPTQAQQAQEPQAQAPQEDPYEKLAKMKKLLDDGVITQEEFDQAKAKLLGI